MRETAGEQLHARTASHTACQGSSWLRSAAQLFLLLASISYEPARGLHGLATWLWQSWCGTLPEHSV